MLGLHDVIYGRRDEIVIVADAGGDPPGDDLPELHLDPHHPERSQVVMRPRRAAADGAARPAGAGAGESSPPPDEPGDGSEPGGA